MNSNFIITFTSFLAAVVLLGHLCLGFPHPQFGMNINTIGPRGNPFQFTLDIGSFLTSKPATKTTNVKQTKPATRTTNVKQTKPSTRTISLKQKPELGADPELYSLEQSAEYQRWDDSGSDEHVAAENDNVDVENDIVGGEDNNVDGENYNEDGEDDNVDGEDDHVDDENYNEDGEDGNVDGEDDNVDGEDDNVINVGEPEDYNEAGEEDDGNFDINSEAYVSDEHKATDGIDDYENSNDVGDYNEPTYREHDGDDTGAEHEYNTDDDNNSIEPDDEDNSELTTDDGEDGDFAEGDIILDDNEEYGDDDDDAGNGNKRWPDNTVIIEIDKSFPAASRAMLQDAMNEISGNTCIRFRRKMRRDIGYVYVYEGTGCFSSVGMTGRKQGLSLGSNCFRIGTYIHELIHAIGFFHAHSRPDRDSYVRIHYQNIRKGSESNFILKRFNDLDPNSMKGIPYDLGSVMHYSQTAMTKSANKLTITPKHPLPPGIVMGQRTGMSVWDIRKINSLYQCPKVRPR